MTTTAFTVKELKEKLNKFPDDYKVIFYEKGSVYDQPVNHIYISGFDKKNKIKRVTLSHK